jgi:hypothetical protein
MKQAKRVTREARLSWKSEPLTGLRAYFRCEELEIISFQRLGPVHSGTGVFKKDLRVPPQPSRPRSDCKAPDRSVVGQLDMWPG